jgi:4-hydroxy-tetrahydrodipicolinate reductase
MRIALIGYGKMGRSIEQEALVRKHEIVSIIHSQNNTELNNLSSFKPDVAIEFTTPIAVISNLEQLIKLGIPVVVGTTGWDAQKPGIQELASQAGVPIIWANNFSIGVNLLFWLNKQLISKMNKYPEYDVAIEERHHRNKLDSPSGTALTLSNQIIDGLERKTELYISDSTHIEKHQLSLATTRFGHIVGTHTVVWNSPHDTLEIKHIANSRQGFCEGVLWAAEKIQLCKPGLYEFSSLLKL